MMLSTSNDELYMAEGNHETSNEGDKEPPDEGFGHFLNPPILEFDGASQEELSEASVQGAHLPDGSSGLR